MLIGLIDENENAWKKWKLLSSQPNNYNIFSFSSFHFPPTNLATKHTWNFGPSEAEYISIFLSLFFDVGIGVLFNMHHDVFSSNIPWVYTIDICIATHLGFISPEGFSKGHMCTMVVIYSNLQIVLRVLLNSCCIVIVLLFGNLLVGFSVIANHLKNYVRCKIYCVGCGWGRPYVGLVL